MAYKNQNFNVKNLSAAQKKKFFKLTTPSFYVKDAAHFFSTHTSAPPHHTLSSIGSLAYKWIRLEFWSCCCVDFLNCNLSLCLKNTSAHSHILWVDPGLDGRSVHIIMQTKWEKKIKTRIDVWECFFLCTDVKSYEHINWVVNFVQRF